MNSNSNDNSNKGNGISNGNGYSDYRPPKDLYSFPPNIGAQYPPPGDLQKPISVSSMLSYIQLFILRFIQSIRLFCVKKEILFFSQFIRKNIVKTSNLSVFAN